MTANQDHPPANVAESTPDEVFYTWPHDPTKIVKEALREFVGDGDGEDERVLAAHEERIRADERERIRREI